MNENTRNDNINSKVNGSSVADPWVICNSKSHPGLKFYFNKVTGIKVWNITASEIALAEKADKNSLEPTGRPKMNDSTDARVFNKQIINNQFSNQLPNLLVNPITGAFNIYDNAQNQISMQGQQLFTLVPAGIAPLFNQLEAPNNLQQAYQQLVQLPNNLQNPNPAYNLPQYSQNWQQPKKSSKCNRYRRNQWLRNHGNNELSPDRFSSNIHNKDLRKKIVRRKSFSGTCHNNDQGRESNIWTNNSTQNDETSIRINLEPLKTLTNSGSDSNQWYIVVDTSVILQNYNYLNNMAASDPDCHLFIPRHVMIELQEHVSKTNDVQARRILRFLTQQIESNLAILGEEVAGDGMSHKTRLTCVKLATQDYHVVLILNENDQFNYETNLKNIHVFTIQELKDILENKTTRRPPNRSRANSPTMAVQIVVKNNVEPEISETPSQKNFDSNAYGNINLHAKRSTIDYSKRSQTPPVRNSNLTDSVFDTRNLESVSSVDNSRTRVQSLHKTGVRTRNLSESSTSEYRISRNMFGNSDNGSAEFNIHSRNPSEISQTDYRLRYNPVANIDKESIEFTSQTRNASESFHNNNHNSDKESTESSRFTRNALNSSQTDYPNSRNLTGNSDKKSTDSSNRNKKTNVPFKTGYRITRNTLEKVEKELTDSKSTSSRRPVLIRNRTNASTNASINKSNNFETNNRSPRKSIEINAPRWRKGNADNSQTEPCRQVVTENQQFSYTPCTRSIFEDNHNSDALPSSPHSSASNVSLDTIGMKRIISMSRLRSRSQKRTINTQFNQTLQPKPRSKSLSRGTSMTSSLGSPVKKNVTIEETSPSAISNSDTSHSEKVVSPVKKVALRTVVMFGVACQSMEDVLKHRSDEWVFRFVQIMEEVLRVKLQEEIPFESKEPAPWNLQEAARCIIKKFSNHFSVVDAANKLSFILYKTSDEHGKISDNILPADYMEMYSYGMFLVETFKDMECTSCKDKNRTKTKTNEQRVEQDCSCYEVNTAYDSLKKLLFDIQNTNLDTFIDHPNDRSMNTTIADGDLFDAEMYTRVEVDIPVAKETQQDQQDKMEYDYMPTGQCDDSTSRGQRDDNTSRGQRDDNTSRDQCYNNTSRGQCDDNTCRDQYYVNTSRGQCDDNTSRDQGYVNTPRKHFDDNTHREQYDNDTPREQCHENTHRMQCDENTPKKHSDDNASKLYNLRSQIKKSQPVECDELPAQEINKGAKTIFLEHFNLRNTSNSDVPDNQDLSNTEKQNLVKSKVSCPIKPYNIEQVEVEPPNTPKEAKPQSIIIRKFLFNEDLERKVRARQNVREYDNEEENAVDSHNLPPITAETKNIETDNANIEASRNFKRFIGRIVREINNIFMQTEMLCDEYAMERQKNGPSERTGALEQRLEIACSFISQTQKRLDSISIREKDNTVNIQALLKLAKIDDFFPDDELCLECGRIIGSCKVTAEEVLNRIQNILKIARA